MANFEDQRHNGSFYRSTFRARRIPKQYTFGTLNVDLCSIKEMILV